MTFKIRQLSWYKRRNAKQEPQPVRVEVFDFQKIVNHACKVVVEFDNGETHQLSGRVLQNPITGLWSVSGINSTGQSVSLQYIED